MLKDGRLADEVGCRMAHSSESLDELIRAVTKIELRKSGGINVKEIKENYRRLTLKT